MELLADIAWLSALLRWKSVGIMECPLQTRRYLSNMSGATIMEYDEKLIEDAVLALLATFSSDNGNAWKGFDFETMNQLHGKRSINPTDSARSAGRYSDTPSMAVVRSQVSGLDACSP
ncbi:DUF6429 family protein [Pseudomonas frederiksbergensis]|uniref:DUF6429 family protein n=1 Tax=Pseudomonas frederiksbergensis TaxID=104087 RepID=UPI00101AEB97|nr:hypothetical protein [Pseudomonas frederiksbergensis]